MPACRFPPPWSVEELDACFVVRDHDGQQLAHVYYEDEPGRLYVHFDEVRSRRAHHARNPNFDRDHRAGDRCSRVVALSLRGAGSCCDAQSLTGSILWRRCALNLPTVSIT